MKPTICAGRQYRKMGRKSFATIMVSMLMIGVASASACAAAPAAETADPGTTSRSAGAGTPPTSGTVVPATAPPTIAAPRFVPLGPPELQYLPNAIVSWTRVGDLVDSFAPLYTATLPPEDRSGPVTVVWMDPTLLRFSLHPGYEEPGGTWQESTEITPDERPYLLAAFNGGFRTRDSHGGFYLDGKGENTLKNGAATLSIDDTGAIGVGAWGRDTPSIDHLVAARQNLTLLVDDRVAAPTAGEQPRDAWGGIIGGGPLTWRSGIGVLGSGALVYLCGPSLTAKRLAAGFVELGAVRAMELDINHPFVTFNTYGHPVADSPAVVLGGTKLLDGMSASGSRYLTNDNRDFVVVLRRDPPT